MLSFRAIVGICILMPSTAAMAETVSLECVVEQSSTRPADAQRPNGSAGERYQFIFNTEGGQASVERNGRGSDGQPVTERWAPQVSLTPTHANFDFRVQHAPNTIVTHSYRIDRSSMQFSGSKDAFGYVQFFVEGSCALMEVPQRSNRF